MRNSADPLDHVPLVRVCANMHTSVHTTSAACLRVSLQYLTGILFQRGPSSAGQLACGPAILRAVDAAAVDGAAINRKQSESRAA